MKNIKATFITLLITKIAFSQQDPQFSMALQNKMSINPGYAGSTGLLCGNLLARQQWTGFDGRPQSLAFAADVPIMKETNHPGGVGLTFIADKAGLQKTTYVKGAYAYRLLMPNGGALGLGLELGLLSVGYNSGFDPKDLGDSKIPAGAVSSGSFDLGFGAHYNVPNKFNVGVSVSHLTASKLTAINYTVARHLYVTAGYDYALPNNPALIIKPSILFKKSLSASKPQLDVNVIALMNNAFWGGLSYRVLGSGAIIPMIGYQATMMEGKGTLKVGYSYDVTFSKLGSYGKSSHEVLLGFCYDITPPVKVTKYRNVRFL